MASPYQMLQCSIGFRTSDSYGKLWNKHFRCFKASILPIIFSSLYLESVHSTTD